MERATGMMLEIDDTDNPEKESFRRDPSGRFGRREAGCERVTRVLVANEPRSYRQAIAAALQVIRPDMEVLVVEPELLDDEVEEQPEHERAEEPRQRGRRLLATPHLLRVDNGEAHAFHKEVDERPGDDNHTQARRRRESPSVHPAIPAASLGHVQPAVLLPQDPHNTTSLQNMLPTFEAAFLAQTEDLSLAQLGYAYQTTKQRTSHNGNSRKFVFR
ncbi:MAG: hypothetical protein M3479_11270 [Actinomycetota bacterium]|nr:hypothetical protein [Actinomycetota bacterium]